MRVRHEIAGRGRHQRTAGGPTMPPVEQSITSTPHGLSSRASAIVSSIVTPPSMPSTRGGSVEQRHAAPGSAPRTARATASAKRMRFSRRAAPLVGALIGERREEGVDRDSRAHRGSRRSRSLRCTARVQRPRNAPTSASISPSCERARRRPAFGHRNRARRHGLPRRAPDRRLRAVARPRAALPRSPCVRHARAGCRPESSAS